MIEKLLCESDYRFMDVIWSNEPLGSSELVKLCNRELGWKKSTTYTMLRKMCENGFAKNEDATVTSVVPKAESLGSKEGERAFHKPRFRRLSSGLPRFILRRQNHFRG